MKKLILLPFLAAALFGCGNDDDIEDTVNAANGVTTNKQYLARTIVEADGEAESVSFNYDGNDKVLSISSGGEAMTMQYEATGEEKLTSITGDGDVMMTSEVTSEVYEAYEIGEVLTFDSKGNPSELELKNEDDPSTFIKAVITYDNNPNAYYSTLEAAGLIDLFDDIRFQFAPSGDIQTMRKLVAVNNPTSIVITADNTQLATVTISYTYDSNNYPTSATLVAVNDDGDTETMMSTYVYK